MAYDVRAPILEIETVIGETGRFFEASAQMRGRVLNSTRVWGHIPYTVKFQLRTGAVLQREGAGGVLSCRIKEMTILKTSHVNTCNY